MLGQILVLKTEKICYFKNTIGEGKFYLKRLNCGSGSWLFVSVLAYLYYNIVYILA